MLYPQNRARLFLFIAAVIALILLAAALPSMRFQPGDPFPFSLFSGSFGLQREAIGVSNEQTGGLGWLPILFFWIGLPFSIIYLIVSPEGRKRLLRMLPLFILLLLFLNWVGNQEFEERELEPEERGVGELGLPDTALPPTPDFVADPPQWLLLSANIIVGLIFLAIIFFIWRWYSRRQADDSQALIIQEAERALADLEAGKDLKNIIMRCYAEMGQVLQKEKHVKRRQGMTVREFEVQLASTGLNDTHIRRLTRLFEQVRYSPNALGGREEREAVDCLNAIVRAYGEAS